MNIIESIYKRKNMPQIGTDNIKSALKKMKELGVVVKKGKIKPTELKPSQKDIYKSKVNKILKRTKSPSGMKPFFISRENYIIDGHHRWSAMKIRFPEHRFDYYKIDLPLEQAIKVYHMISNSA